MSTTRWGAYISEMARQNILKAHEFAGQPAAALQVGCEGGRWAKLLADRGWEMTCTDVDPQAIETCRSRNPSAKCIVVDRNDQKFPCPNDSIDLVLCIEVAPVIQSDWFIGEADRVLRPGGVIVGVFLNQMSGRGYFAHCVASMKNNYDYYQFTYWDFRRRLSAPGFKVVREIGYSWFPFRRHSDSVLVPFLTRLEKALGLRKLPALSPWIAFIAKR